MRSTLVSAIIRVLSSAPESKAPHELGGGTAQDEESDGDGHTIL